MPAKRSSNAAKGGRSSGARAAAPVSPVAHDLIGVGIIVVAIAMIVALVTPSSAIVTHAMAEGLRLGFGEGALLVPAALLLFALSMFLPLDAGFVGRVALGLALVVLAVLSMLSIFSVGADSAPEAVLDARAASSTGGYVGAGIAWLLLTFVGQVVGVVVLAGLAVAGVVVCGFSISDFVLRVRASMGAAAERLSLAREERASERASRSLREPADGAWGEGETSVLDEGDTRVVSKGDESATSFIGARKTSVLRRRERRDSGVDHATATMPIEGLAEAKPEPATSILRRRRKKGADVAQPEKAQPVVEERGAASGSASEAESTGAAASVAPAVPSGDTPVSADAASEVPFIEDAPARASAPDERSVPEFLRVAAGTQPRNAASSPTRQVSERRKRAAKAAAPETAPRPGDGSEDFTLPPLTLLSSNPNSASSASTDAELERTARRLQSTLEEFGLTSRVSGWTAGPLVTTFKIEMGEGERVNKITNLQDDIQLSLASESVRIFAPIPGTSLVGIEIPNKRRQNVCLGDVLPYAKGGPLEFAIGRDSEGAPVVADLARMPHMLVAGTTGSGKSVLINAIIMSLIMRTTPEQVRLILVDPKRVEFSCYAGLPHLYVPVVTEPRQAASALQWAVTEMDRRLKVFERAGARDVKVYNKMVADGKFAEQENPPKPMPYLVIVIDELSDLMMVAGKDVEASVVRIAQLARAAGIHLVLATQRPSADVVTGLIKSNVDTRVALKVSSSIDSRVILDQTGAERLMGRGDMLFRKSGGVLRRVLGAYASDEEIESVVSFIRDQREPEYHDEILSAVVPGQPGAATPDSAEEDDPLVWEAAQVVVDSQLGSTSGLQRRLKVGYARAGRIMDNLEQKGVVGPPDGSKPREVLLDAEGLEELRHAEEAYREV